MMVGLAVLGLVQVASLPPISELLKLQEGAEAVTAVAGRDRSAKVRMGSRNFIVVSIGSIKWLGVSDQEKKLTGSPD